MVQKLPSEIENKLAKLQELQDQLKMILMRKQQLQLQLRESENALSEVKKLGDDSEVYKSAGFVLFKSSKEKVLEELTDKKETLELRIKTVEKQENLIRRQFEELRKDVARVLSGSNLPKG